MRTPALLSCSLLTLAACSGDAPPDPATVRAHITNDLGYVAHQTADAGNGAAKMLPTGSLDLFERVAGLSGGTSVGNAVARLVAPDAGGGEGGGESDELDVDSLIDKLNTEVFTDANQVEPGVYAVPDSLVCTDSETMTIDPDCATSWAKLALRLRVVSDGAGLAFAIQLDANHDEPIEIGLQHDKVTLTVDLDAADAATAAIAAALGEEAPNAHLSGQVTASLTVLGTAHVGVAFQIDRAVSVAVADQGTDLNGPDAFRLSSAQAHVLDLDLDGSAGAGLASLGLGATTAHLPDEDGAFDLDLPGASAEVHLSSASTIQIDHVSLGDRTTTLSRGGSVGLAIDLNPADGRALSATVSLDAATGIETLAVTPKLDVRVTQNHAVLGDEAPIYDVTGVLLDGTLEASEDSDQVRVATGTFGIATNPTSYGFTATAGQCVSSIDVTDPDTFDSYTEWSAGTCE